MAEWGHIPKPGMGNGRDRSDHREIVKKSARRGRRRQSKDRIREGLAEGCAEVGGKASGW